MDGFHYYNLFETKGMEYILTIVFFLLLVPFWLLLNTKAKRKHALNRLGIISASKINLPRGVYHSPNHSWMYLLKSGKARIGLSDLLLKMIGSIEVIPLTNVGEKITKGTPLVEIRQGDKKIILNAPISGIVLGFSHENTADIITDPYGSGWIAEIEPTAWIAETSNYYLADDARHWASLEVIRFRDFLVKSLAKHEPQLQPMALQDGGELKEHIMEEMPQAVWNDFQEEFISN
ncbi:MAG TPA: hypothetical protein PKE03_08035 [Bacteroidales bacterium]|nr:hypothetical protein [Bacteroidales bacterium]